MKENYLEQNAHQTKTAVAIQSMDFMYAVKKELYAMQYSQMRENYMVNHAQAKQIHAEIQMKEHMCAQKKALYAM